MWTRRLTWLAIGVLALPLNAKELAGVKLDEVVSMSPSGVELRLNGAAVRTKAQHALYVGGLYLAEESASLESILSDKRPKRFLLHCKTSAIPADKLIEAVNRGFHINHSSEELAAVADELDQFNRLWQTEITRDDEVWIDYLPEKGTVIQINGEEKGVIAGEAFYNAFLKVWLGDHPVNPKLKQGLLGR